MSEKRGNGVLLCVGLVMFGVGVGLIIAGSIDVSRIDADDGGTPARWEFVESTDGVDGQVVFMYRMKVPSGWIVLHESWLTDHPSESMTFVPDGSHMWRLDDDGDE